MDESLPSSDERSRRPNKAPIITLNGNKRLERPEALGTGQNEIELESTIRDYLEDLSAKAFAETPYVGELSGLSFAKLAKASVLSKLVVASAIAMLTVFSSVRHGMHISPAPFRHCSSRRPTTDHVNLPPLPSLPDTAHGNILFHAAFMHVQARYPFMQASLCPLFPQSRLTRHSGVSQLNGISVPRSCPSALLRRWHEERQTICSRGRGSLSLEDKDGVYDSSRLIAAAQTKTHRRILHLDDLCGRR